MRSPESKREVKLIEKVIALGILLLLSPVILIVLEIVLLITGESPIYVQRRGLTLDGKLFYIYKIRTIKTSYSNEQIKTQQIFHKKEETKNIPLFCLMLRKTGFDEILQLVNVIKGEMSIVGPRPFMLEDLKLMKENYEDLYQRRMKLLSKPGITGYWQVFGDKQKGVVNMIDFDEFYERNNRFIDDLFIVLRSIIIILTAGHTDSIKRGKRKENSMNRITIKPMRVKKINF